MNLITQIAMVNDPFGGLMDGHFSEDLMSKQGLKTDVAVQLNIITLIPCMPLGSPWRPREPC